MIGSKYETTKGLKKAEVAKLIRADLKEAFPGIKFSVRTAHFSGGGSIDITILSLPAGMRVRNPGNRAPDGRHQWMTDEAIAFERSVSAVADAYNFDHSEIETDYFHVRFYCEVRFASELTEAKEDAPAAPARILATDEEECDARWDAFLGRQ